MAVSRVQDLSYALPPPGIRFSGVAEGVLRMTTLVKSIKVFHGIRFYECDWSLVVEENPLNVSIESRYVYKRLYKFSIVGVGFCSKFFILA